MRSSEQLEQYFSLLPLPGTELQMHNTGRGGGGGYLVISRFEPSQPLGIISGLRETFVKRYIAERTYEGELLGEFME